MIIFCEANDRDKFYSCISPCNNIAEHYSYWRMGDKYPLYTAVCSEHLFKIPVGYNEIWRHVSSKSRYVESQIEYVMES
jgi:hypothetical protein